MARYEDLPYRTCVGMMLINKDGLVFIGRRAGGTRFPAALQPTRATSARHCPPAVAGHAPERLTQHPATPLAAGTRLPKAPRPDSRPHAAPPRLSCPATSPRPARRGCPSTPPPRARCPATPRTPRSAAAAGTCPAGRRTAPRGRVGTSARSLRSLRRRARPGWQPESSGDQPRVGRRAGENLPVLAPPAGRAEVADRRRPPTPRHASGRLHRHDVCAPFSCARPPTSGN